MLCTGHPRLRGGKSRVAEQRRKIRLEMCCACIRTKGGTKSREHGICSYCMHLLLLLRRQLSSIHTHTRTHIFRRERERENE